jgi:hypothetical protein
MQLPEGRKSAWNQQESVENKSQFGETTQQTTDQMINVIEEDDHAGSSKVPILLNDYFEVHSYNGGAKVVDPKQLVLTTI